MINPAISVLTRYHAEYAEVKKTHDRMVSDCAATKTTPPDNYWQLEHKARRKVQLAMEVAGIIQDEIDERL